MIRLGKMSKRPGKQGVFSSLYDRISIAMTVHVMADWIVVGVARISVSSQRLDLFPQIDTSDLG